MPKTTTSSKQKSPPAASRPRQASAAVQAALKREQAARKCDARTWQETERALVAAKDAAEMASHTKSEFLANVSLDILSGLKPGDS